VQTSSWPKQKSRIGSIGGDRRKVKTEALDDEDEEHGVVQVVV
jgi:hypothetical protein